MVKKLQKKQHIAKEAIEAEGDVHIASITK